MVTLAPFLITLDLRGGSLRVRYQVQSASPRYTGVIGTGEVGIGETPEIRKALDAFVAVLTNQINEMTVGPLPDTEVGADGEASNSKVAFGDDEGGPEL